MVLRTHRIELRSQSEPVENFSLKEPIVWELTRYRKLITEGIRDAIAFLLVSCCDTGLEEGFGENLENREQF